MLSNAKILLVLVILETEAVGKIALISKFLLHFYKLTLVYSYIIIKIKDSVKEKLTEFNAVLEYKN